MMTHWTRETLAAHRARMGWPPLPADALDQVVAILREAEVTRADLALPAAAEPAPIFIACSGADHG